MDGWPKSWRSLEWFSLAADCVKSTAGWVWRHLCRYDPNRRY